MGRANLRAVATQTPARAPEAVGSVTHAAQHGTTRELLVALRSRIATAVDNPKTPARELASLTKRLVEVVHDIEALDARADREVAGRDLERKPFDYGAL